MRALFICVSLAAFYVIAVCMQYFFYYKRRDYTFFYVFFIVRPNLLLGTAIFCTIVLILSGVYGIDAVNEFFDVWNRF